MTLYSEATGRKIVSVETAETVGKVSGFVLDPATRSICALSVKKSDSGDTVRWSDLIAFGADAITVATADRIGAADPAVAALASKERKILGKLVLSARGNELGKVDDVEFDPGSSLLIALVLAGRQGQHRVDGARLLGVGSYAVVMNV